MNAKLITIAALAFACAACPSDAVDSAPAAGVDASSTDAAEPTSSAAATATPEDATTTPATSEPATQDDRTGDWDGVAFDFGVLTAVDTEAAAITFDRAQVYVQQDSDDYTLESAPTFTAEPIVWGNTDAPYVNENTRLRTYVLADGATVLTQNEQHMRDAGYCDFTAPDDYEPTYDTATLAELAELIDTEPQNQVSLTFTDEGQVSLIRVNRSC